MTDFLPAIFLGIILSFTIGPVFFTILEISVSKGFKAAVFFNIGVVFSEIVFFAIAYASTSSLLESIQENPSWKVLGGVLLSFYAQVYFGWAGSKYNTFGYLHWGLNQYKANPFKQSVVKHPSPQASSNNFLPAGDTHVIYPGTVFTHHTTNMHMHFKTCWKKP